MYIRANIRFKLVPLSQCCGAGAESQGADIKFCPGAGAKVVRIAAPASAPAPFYLPRNFWKIIIAEECFANCNNFNLIT